MDLPEGVTILRGVLVLAINSTMEQARGSKRVESATSQQQRYRLNPATITVAVTPKEADLLAAVDQTIPLRLALRSPQEPVRSLPGENLDAQAPNTEHNSRAAASAGRAGHAVRAACGARCAGRCTDRAFRSGRHGYRRRSYRVGKVM